MKKNLYKGEVFYFTDSPSRKDSYRYFERGGLAVVDGKVVQAGPFEELSSLFPDFQQVDYSGCLIMPGLIDTHIHFPQTEMIGMYGRQLLDWLDEYTFPTEAAYASFDYAYRMAHNFMDELLKNGTTTGVAFASVHPESVNALFTVASELNMCMLAGKVLMNRNAPEFVRDTTATGEQETRELIDKWHENGRNRYVITPRFAITSTPDQLASVGRLHKEFPTTYIQTHLSENRAEIESVKSLFENSTDYLEVYERAGILTDRSIFAHCVHLTDREYQRLAETNAIIAHCPTSNLFLGSGLFHMEKANSYHLRTTLATDVGAGTSFSMWKTMGEAYKVQQLQGYSLTALESLYKCTLGAAKALGLEDRIGSFQSGNDADFIVLDYQATSAQKLRMNNLKSRDKATLENKLFGLQIMGDDRNTMATYVMGERKYAAQSLKL